MTVDPDKPVTEAEYLNMRDDALHYGTGDLPEDLREDRAFLLYEVQKYEQAHGRSLTFEPDFVQEEYDWWHDE